MFEHNYSLKYKKGFLSHSELWVSHVNPGNTAYRSYCKGSKTWRGTVHTENWRSTGEREEPVLQARPGSQSHLNPLPAVRLSEHIGVLGVQLPGSSPWYTANAPAGTARTAQTAAPGLHGSSGNAESPFPTYCWASCSPSVDCFNVLMWNSGETKVQKGYKPFLCDLTYKTNPFTSSASLWKAEGNEQEWPLGNLKQLWKMRDAVPWWGLAGGEELPEGSTPELLLGHWQQEPWRVRFGSLADFP